MQIGIVHIAQLSLYSKEGLCKTFAMRSSPKKPNDAQPRVMIGYARVSTEDQDLSIQIDALLRAGVEENHLYVDKKSGKTLRRKGLEEALLDARKGDIFVIYKIDRLSRTLKDLIYLAERLEQDGIELRSLNDNIDTTTIAGRAFFQLMGVFAEFERSMIGWRTTRGMQAAKAKGTRFGPKPKFTKADVRKAISMLKVSRSPVAVAKHFGITPQLVRMRVLEMHGKPLWDEKPWKRKRKQGK